MDLQHRIKSLSALGTFIEQKLANAGDDEFDRLLRKAHAINPWFTEGNILLALSGIRKMLTKTALESWAGSYPELQKIETNKTVGAVLAGNLPLVGFHDVLCSIIAGYNFIGKLSSKDPVLLPYLVAALKNIDPALASKIELTDHFLTKFDVVIATGNNNSSRYFEQYFGKYPHIIRKNRTSVAVLNGDETDADYEKLTDDVFLYFGLGCRSVSKLYVPTGFTPDRFYEATERYASIAQHNKYINNYEYNRAINLMNSTQHFDNGFCILVPHEAIGSPIGVMYYQEYETFDSVIASLDAQSESIQCIVSKMDGFHQPSIPLGQAQFPDVSVYADGTDTLQFLINNA